MHPARIGATVVAAALSLALSPLDADAQSAVGTPLAATVGTSAAVEIDRLRVQAWRGRADQQLDLAMRLGDAHRRDASPSAMVEAAYWAGRAWNSPAPVAPDAIAAFVARNCGSAAISRHWVCTEGE